MPQPAWKVILAVGGCAVVAYFLAPGEAVKDGVYSGIGLFSALAVVVATRLRRPAQRAGWYLLAAATTCVVLGDGVLDIYDLVLHQAAPFPSDADARYLSGYPFLFAGVFQISRLRGAPGARESATDAAMVSVGALAVSWQFLMGSYAHDASTSQFGKFMTLAYPVMDIGVLFIVVSAIMTGTARRPTDRLLGIGVCLMLIADFGCYVLILHSSYSVGNPIDAGFLLFYIFIAAAACHPSAAHPSPVAVDPRERRRPWLPLVAAAARCCTLGSSTPCRRPLG